MCYQGAGVLLCMLYQCVCGSAIVCVWAVRQAGGHWLKPQPGANTPVTARSCSQGRGLSAVEVGSCGGWGGAGGGMCWVVDGQQAKCCFDSVPGSAAPAYSGACALFWSTCCNGIHNQRTTVWRVLTCFMHIQCRKHAILCINHMPDAWYACACAHEDGGQPTAMNNMHCCCAVGSRLRPPPVRTLCLL